MKRMTPNEMLEEVKRALAIKRWGYTLKQHDWFSPSDAMPHSSQFKYMCKRLYELGMLERIGDRTARWGYYYRIPGEPK